ncbi:bifunctional adenosylcobinamide kinase/adenosylcobinamide-phosphate guanylyltransferase [Colwellia ponticola]|uniref:Bifunctional adenosylcobalamin biosynthesis protein n=1 Tax=Colwellia ponticola TaxID=2304625 RepID=A0A8H2JNF7_9GAMM|nr:bifunctional adenosylcobinamide kinase/adenosylcobinamide-phosphate guanylyltransferase [Colwellia ponticola]TMM46851.1 bifunctional adenosylcobinamide kinase/adenosylcobinamide-phosphate guanylyltransferase [Colwellia ponticola]
MIHFILGGARSGKSSFGEQQALALANKQGKSAVYIATATAFDAEMTSRIAQHQGDRGDNWQLIECPLTLADTVNTLDHHQVYLVDCLTLWLNNQLYAAHEASRVEQSLHLQTQIDKLVSCLAKFNDDPDSNIIIVSNEIGLGVIPMGESTRLYVDYCGWLNQKVAAIADNVTLVTAGIPLALKSEHKK